jgi:hypothetical protein
MNATINPEFCDLQQLYDQVEKECKYILNYTPKTLILTAT